MLLFLYKLPERKEKMFIIISNGKDALIKNGGIVFNCHLRYEALSYEEEWKKIKEKINNFYVSSKLNFFYRIFETIKYCMKLGIQIDFLRIETKRNLQYKNIKEFKVLAKEFPLYVKTFNMILERTPNSLGVEERRIRETEFGIEIRRSEKDIYVKLDKIEVFDAEKLKGIARFLTENDRKYGYFSPLDIAEKIIETTEKIKELTELHRRQALLDERFEYLENRNMNDWILKNKGTFVETFENLKKQNFNDNFSEAAISYLVANNKTKKVFYKEREKNLKYIINISNEIILNAKKKTKKNILNMLENCKTIKSIETLNNFLKP